MFIALVEINSRTCLRQLWELVLSFQVQISSNVKLESITFNNKFREHRSGDGKIKFLQYVLQFGPIRVKLTNVCCIAIHIGFQPALYSTFVLFLTPTDAFLTNSMRCCALTHDTVARCRP